MAVGDALVRRSCTSWLGVACVAVTVACGMIEGTARSMGLTVEG
jgi:hypothetical protein